jgi:hypothetical protein
MTLAWHPGNNATDINTAGLREGATCNFKSEVWCPEFGSLVGISSRHKKLGHGFARIFTVPDPPHITPDKQVATSQPLGAA